ncbi:MAG: putative DNA binding domain-containing protein [Acidobacteria bacterium]|nr:putative DNA binding domain-containing protein [Acidobacteriota bacterium]
MMLERVLRLPEGKKLEFKRDCSSPQPLLRTLVAFANSAGGTVVIGVEDGTRNVVGVPNPLELEQRIANLVADSIVPRLLPEIDIVPWRNTHVLAIGVHSSQLRPHHVSAMGPERGTFVRLGSTNRTADPALIAELRRGAELRSYDEQPLPGSEALDFAAASECFAEVRRLRPPDLATLRLVTEHQGRVVPTIGGAILFGPDRLDHLPDAWVQAGLFAGKDKSVIADRAEIREYPLRAIDAAIRFVERNTRLGAEIGGAARRRDLPAVPPGALREALVNAVVHSDYSQRGAPIRVAVFDDRVEVENPGILLPGLTVEDLAEGVSRLRNHVIGRVFQELGIVEQWGSGIQRMTSACIAAGLPAPEFVEIGLRFRVVLRTVPIAAPAVDAVERRILDYVGAPEGRSTAEIARQVALTTRATQHRLAKLVERGLVVAIGSGPRDPRRRWFLGGRERRE